MGWIGCVRWEKSQRDFAAPTFTIIAPVHPVLHRVSCSYETIPNAPKHYEMHQNMSLRSNGVDLVRSLQKITMCFVGRTFVSIALVQYVLHPLSCTYEMIPNAPKYYELHQNISLGSNGWIRCVRCKKLKCDFVGRTFVLIAPVQYVLHQLSCTLWNDPKCTQILRIAPKH